MSESDTGDPERRAETERRVAIVGCGAISRAHAAALRGLAGFEIAAVVDSSPAALEAAEREFEVPGFSSAERLIETADDERACDTAVVCTPPSTHRAVAEALLRSGVDVLCEKPLATTSADGRALAETAEREGRRLAVSAKFRHVGDLAVAAERVHAGEIGTPLSYAVTFCAPVDVRGRWPSNPELSGGGVLMDNMPHALDVLSHFLDGPVGGLRGRFADPVLAPPVEDTATVLFDTAAGALGRIELSWSYFTQDLDYLVVQGSEGTVCVGWTGGRIRRHGDREWEEFGTGYDKGSAFRGVWTAFADGAALRPPSGVEALELIERVYESASG